MSVPRVLYQNINNTFSNIKQWKTRDNTATESIHTSEAKKIKSKVD